MESPFYNLGTSHNRHKKLPFEGLYCGCGLILQTSELFKVHYFEVHRQKFVRGSSHYVVQFSEVVLPVRCWDVSMMKGSLLGEFPSDEEVKMPTNSLVHQGKNSGESYKSGPMAQKELKVKKSDREVSLPRERRRNEKGGSTLRGEQRGKVHEWNGFILIPNKLVLSDQLLCGICEQTFISVEKYITHCFDECQKLNHPNSSHFVELSEKNPQHYHKELAEQIVKTERRRKAPQRSQLQSNVIQTEKKARRNHNLQDMAFKAATKFEIPTAKKGVYDSLLALVVHQTFNCGCGKSILRGKFYLHLQAHDDMVPENSSHVFLKKNVGKKLVMLRVSGPDDGRMWWCPCRPATTMNRAKFINHIIYVHKGFSPMYKPEHFRNDQ